MLQTWSKQIEQVLAESEQMRREADDIGPTAELAYWKSRMAKFNKYDADNCFTVDSYVDNCFTVDSLLFVGYQFSVFR